MAVEQAFLRFSTSARGNIGVPLLLLTLLGMMTLPVPPFLLDTLFSFNIALSIVVLLVSVYALRPLDFAVFPTILLVATLLRLALNVASTRVVLLDGHSGGDAAGKVIQSFGEVVIGGNYAVGLVVFLILMIINFVVVTKGAGRISEVSARFTLDAMPGKQMAIDADLNAGILTQDEAKLRRQEVGSEADFYGAMDGASKFVRGDAIAGILILMINILGGIGVGMLQHDLDFSRAMEVYTLLTIGDGLVAQIPSLLLSTAAAIMVTRVNSESDVREQVVDQMFTSPKALTVAAGILVVMGLIPGMPHFSFITLGIVCAAGAFFIQRRVLVDEQVVEDQSRAQALMDAQQSQSPSGELGWDDVSPVDIVGLEVGYRLIPMVDKNQSGELLGRIKGIRKKLSQEIGFLVPAVHIRDNLELPPNGYRISLMGVTLGESEVHPDRHMAINPGQVFGNIEGLPVKDPAFGLDAVWIDNAIKDHAQTLGYTVVDASTVVATHMNTLLQKHVHELLGHEEVQQMIDRLARYSPKLVDTLVPETVSMSVLLKVLKGLLAEQLPVRDFRTIAEAIVANAAVNSEPMQLIESVRTALSRSIVQEIYGSDNNLSVFTLAPAMEQMLMKPSANGGLDVTLEPGLAEQLQRSISETAQAQELKGSPAVLLVPGPLRPILAKFVRFSSHALHVLSYNEIPDDKQVTIEPTVG
ncbi:MAG TPA: flagellar biosynthesis protein FlhA [Cellvibrionales bacterium]|nr:flagellar biosynthesis protein FlhA [Cellvibrionales bacterium]